jgi:hypothetical protein
VGGGHAQRDGRQALLWFNKNLRGLKNLGGLAEPLAEREATKLGVNMKYVFFLLMFYVQSLFCQVIIAEKQILTNLPIEFELGGKDPNHVSGKPMTSYFSGDKQNTMMLWGKDDNITIIGVMMQIDKSLNDEQKKLAHAIIRNIFSDSLTIEEWFDKTLDRFDMSKAKRASQTFQKRIIEISYYPNMSVFLNIANEGETLKHN